MGFPDDLSCHFLPSSNPLVNQSAHSTTCSWVFGGLQGKCLYWMKTPPLTISIGKFTWKWAQLWHQKLHTSHSGSFFFISVLTGAL